MATFALEDTYDLADPVDAAPGILGLAVPDPPAQALDLLDDHGLRLHPAGPVGRQSACCVRCVLKPHGDVKPIEDWWFRDPGIDQDGPQPGTTVRECGQLGGVGLANGLKGSADQRRDVGASLGDRSEHLPASAGCLDVTDADLQVPFALFATADERRIDADGDCR